MYSADSYIYKPYSPKLDWSDSPPFGRRRSLIHTLELLHQRSTNPYIMELGTAGHFDPSNLGNALLAFAFYCRKYGGTITTCDIRKIPNAKELLTEHAPGCMDSVVMTFVDSDVIDFAETVHEPIDLLYMDALMELAADPELGPYARRFNPPSFYVELFNRFDPACFHSGSLMLWDDTDPRTYFGKGMFLIPKLLASGWSKVEIDGVPVHPMVLLEKV